MHGTRYNVPLLNALAFYVGIQVGFTTPHTSAQVSMNAAACQMGKAGIGNSDGFSMACDALLAVLASYLGIQVGVTVPEHVQDCCTHTYPHLLVVLLPACGQCAGSLGVQQGSVQAVAHILLSTVACQVGNAGGLRAPAPSACRGEPAHRQTAPWHTPCPKRGMHDGLHVHKAPADWGRDKRAGRLLPGPWSLSLSCITTCNLT